jgi:cytochrome b involved in lipid metabolism
MSIIFQEGEIAQHNTLEDCWVIAHGNVYDITKFVNRHPGGKYVLKSNAGKDVSRHFDFHPDRAQKIWKKFLIGTISKSTNCGCF